jgi:hypothetical protein
MTLLSSLFLLILPSLTKSFETKSHFVVVVFEFLYPFCHFTTIHREREYGKHILYLVFMYLEIDLKNSSIPTTKAPIQGPSPLPSSRASFNSYVRVSPIATLTAFSIAVLSPKIYSLTMFVQFSVWREHDSSFFIFQASYKNSAKLANLRDPSKGLLRCLS